MGGETARLVLSNLPDEEPCQRCGRDPALPGSTECLRCVREAPTDEEDI